MHSGHISLVQRRLLQRLEEIELLVGDLIAERKVVEGLLLRERGRDDKSEVPIRRNGVGRTVVEGRVIELLERHKIPLHGKYLLAQIKLLLPQMKEPTFRSHLHRMKTKGLIMNSKPGFWLLNISDGVQTGRSV